MHRTETKIALHIQALFWTVCVNNTPERKSNQRLYIFLQMDLSSFAFHFDSLQNAGPRKTHQLVIYIRGPLLHLSTQSNLCFQEHDELLGRLCTLKRILCKFHGISYGGLHIYTFCRTLAQDALHYQIPDSYVKFKPCLDDEIYVRGSPINETIPSIVGTWGLCNVASLSMQCHEVASTLIWRCFDVLCLLGYVWIH